MNWKNSLLLRVTAVCLTAPFTLAPATASPLHRSTAKELTQQVSRDSPSLELLPLGQPNLLESRVLTELAPGLTYTNIVRGIQSDRDKYALDVAVLAVNGRTSLILPSASGKDARIEALTTQETATATDGATYTLNGLNRKPGLIRSCGGVAGELATVAGETIPYTNPKHDFTCTNPNELIEFTPAFGQTSESAVGREVVLDSSGQVIEQRDGCGGEIPDSGILCGTGNAVEWLHEHAQRGAKIAIGYGL